MGYATTTDEDGLEFSASVDEVECVRLGAGNGIEGFIVEPDVPHKRLHSSQIIMLAQFLLRVAIERADEEFSDLEREKMKEPTKDPTK
jgi:hypothetical protein